jgi:hypothetical protein
MVRLVSNDDVSVEFPKKLVADVPYVKDAFDKDIDDDAELLCFCSTGLQLLLLKEVLAARLADGGSFLPLQEKITIGACELAVPSFISATWSPSLDVCFKDLSETQIIDLFYVSDFMCMWELRSAIIILLLHKKITQRWEFNDFFQAYNPRVKEIIRAVYYESTIDMHNDYYAHQDNTHLV